jgi:hypothetical protein
VKTWEPKTTTDIATPQDTHGNTECVSCDWYETTEFPSGSLEANHSADQTNEIAFNQIQEEISLSWSLFSSVFYSMLQKGLVQMIHEPI